MYHFPYESAGGSAYPGPARDGRSHGLGRMILVALVVGIVVSLLLGPALWAAGLAFHLVAAIVRLALLGAVAIFLWRRIRRRIGVRRGM